jgi:chromosome segregation ATPase
VTCGNAGSNGLASLNTVTVNNQVPFVYDITQVQQQQVQADKQLFAALAAVNSAKSDVATREGLYNNINTQLAAAQAAADKAAAAAANANTNRQNAATRLTATNGALNDAEDKLNLALLYQAGAQANVKKAEANLAAAQNAFNNAQQLLAQAEAALQAAQATLNDKKLAETEANTNLLNAQKDYNRANQDLN